MPRPVVEEAQPANVRPTPPPVRTPVAEAPRYARAEWDRAVREALRSGTIAMPAVLSEIQLGVDPQRGLNAPDGAWLEPAGRIVETTRPTFTWSPAADARYVVAVSRDAELVAESPELRQTRWQPRRDLQPGAMYQWQVEIRRPSGTAILPAPPAPPAFFRVLDAASRQDLADARRQHGDDPLLLGILYARTGLRTEAERELAKVDTPEGRRLLQSVRAWKVVAREPGP